MTTSKYEQLSSERKRLKSIGESPEWLSTPAFQMLSNQGYLQPGETPKGMYTRIAKRLGSLVDPRIDVKLFGDFNNWEEAFFHDMWKGWLSPATPELVSIGTERGMGVSCSGVMPDDSIEGFYDTRREIALLTKEGFGTTVCLDPIRHRGSAISNSTHKASGVTQLMLGLVRDMEEISQGSRRGQIGQYLNPMHPDFDEVVDQLIADDVGLNIGWNLTDAYEELFQTNPQRADKIFQRMMKVKALKGKGYFFKKDHVNRRRPQMYKDRGFVVESSSLCNEINLFCDKDHTFSCVLASVNRARYEEWKYTKLEQRGMIFLYAVIEDFLSKAKGKPGFEKVVRFTDKTRAVGLGVMGEASYYQSRGWVYGGVESRRSNKTYFQRMNDETLKVSKYLAKTIGEPEYMKGYGEYFSHRMAIAPTTSTSVILGNPSRGIEPVYANVYMDETAAGAIYTINPQLFKLLKSKNLYSEDMMRRISQDNGSIQKIDEFTASEKAIFMTAFEIDQEFILQMGSDRQQFIDQSQSLNLYFDKTVKEEEFARLHHLAIIDPHILGLYYVRALDGEAHKLSKDECIACQG